MSEITHAAREAAERIQNDYLLEFRETGTAVEAERNEIAELIQSAIDQARAADEGQMLKLIDERDAAEDALSEAYHLVTGNPAEWSNHFGFKQALEEIDAAKAADQKAIEEMRAKQFELWRGLRLAHDMMVTWFSSEYADSPQAITIRKLIDLYNPALNSLKPALLKELEKPQ